MLKILAALVVVLVVGVLIAALTKPDTFAVQRSATIKAPPEKIFAVLNDFHRWPDWSPWEKLDPQMKRTLGGAERGRGATYAWEGNSKAGAGRMEIIDSVPAQRVGIQLDFIKPFEGHNVATFTLAPQGDATQVNWRMDGPTPFVSKVMQVFVSMDSLIGKDFEEGLANLKALAERP
ncbi:MAG TPA: SRPBCC family protein [Burkholderiaceae bacterium]|nr:SRPBCC family protein [Burkholderiaceae bacterium]